MNSSHVDHQPATHTPDDGTAGRAASKVAEAAAITAAAAVADGAATAIDLVADRPAARRVVAAIGRPVHVVIGAARVGVSAIGRGTRRIAVHLPGTMRATRSAAGKTVEALQALPDTTLRSLAATSVGLGAGLSFTRAGRLAWVAGLVPAVVVTTVIAARPLTPASEDVTAG